MLCLYDGGWLVSWILFILYVFLQFLLDNLLWYVFCSMCIYFQDWFIVGVFTCFGILVGACVFLGTFVLCMSMP